jgi:class 3 adenylate cyclase
MFSDLVGSTALSARMDLEDLREVISAYQRCAADTVRRFGGFVAKYMGDTIIRSESPEGSMSPTHFAVRMAAADQRLELARKAQNIPAMQSALAEKTWLIRAHYGAPQVTR